jgi:hypothetical protein
MNFAVHSGAFVLHAGSAILYRPLKKAKGKV